MDIQNKRSVVVFPLLLSLVLAAGIVIGIRFSKSGVNDRLLIYPRSDKVNNVLNLIEDSYVDSVSRDKLEVTAIESVLQKLDPHSVYIPAEEVQALSEPLDGNFDGIGVQYYVIEDTVVVINTVSNGPAERAGIESGDRLVGINDSIIAGKKLASADIIRRLKGKKGTVVKVTVKRPDREGLMDFQVTREQIPLHSIDVAYMIAPGIGYIKINKFAKTTHDEFVSAAKRLHEQGMKKIIVDLRENTGGYLEATIKIADEFLDDHQLIVYTQGRARPRSDAFSSPGGECLNDSVVIIVNESTASASEILAGAIQDNDRGWIVGRRSFGKGLVQEPTLLPGGAAIRLTIARYYTPSGRCIQKPYNNGKKSYYNELRKRILHGEMEQADSIRFIDSLKYTTPSGRIVYGGGGIMPDFFVPADTSGFSEYYYKLQKKGLIYQFAFYYSDHQRKTLAAIKDYHHLIKLLEKEHIMDKFISYAEKEGIKATPEDVKASSQLIETYLYAYVARNFFDNDGFYPIVNGIDNTVKKAIEVSDARNNHMLSQIKSKTQTKRQKF